MVAGGEEGGGEDSNWSRSSLTVCSEPVDTFVKSVFVLCVWTTVVSLADTLTALFADTSFVCEEVGTHTLT